MNWHLIGIEPRGQRRPRLSPQLQYVLAVFVMTRVLTSAWTALAAGWAPIHHPWESSVDFQTIFRIAYPHSSQVADLLLGNWYRWDTGWYMTIAVRGYGTPLETVIFPPLYPLLTGLLGRLLGGEYLLAGVVVSNLAYLGALYVLFILISSQYSDSIARSAIIWLVMYPGAFFFLAAYSDSLFLLLALLTYLTAQRKRWLLCGLAAFLATLTRLTGWVLAVPVAWEVLSATGWKPWPVHPKEWLGLVVRAGPKLLVALGAPLGLVMFYAYLYIAGLPVVGQAFDQLWQVRVTWPWQPVLGAIRQMTSGPLSLVQVLNFVTLVFFSGLLFTAGQKLRPTWWLFVACSITFFLLRDYPVRQLDGTLRYLAVLFPIFLTLALWKKSAWLNAGLKALFFVLQVLLLGLFSRWLWVS